MWWREKESVWLISSQVHQNEEGSQELVTCSRGVGLIIIREAIISAQHAASLHVCCSWYAVCTPYLKNNDSWLAHILYKNVISHCRGTKAVMRVLIQSQRLCNKGTQQARDHSAEVPCYRRQSIQILLIIGCWNGFLRFNWKRASFIVDDRDPA